MVLSMLPRSRASAPRTTFPTQTLRSAALAAGVSYASATLGFALVRPLLGKRQGWIELVDDLEPWAYLPAPVIGTAGALLACSPLTAAGAALGAAFALRWGHRFLRPAPDPARASADFTVMTFNTLAWFRSADDLKASIVKANPDLVGLQEIGPNATGQLIRALGDRYPYSFATESATSSGAAVLSRYPLLDPTEFRLSEKAHWWQRMIVDAPSGPITYLNIHTKIPRIRRTVDDADSNTGILPNLRTEPRSREVWHLAEMLDKIEGPVIVAGDFNMTERCEDYRLVASRLRDAYKAVGRGLGHTFPAWGRGSRMFPAFGPMLRLDYVWHSDHFSAAWALKGDAGKSDHHPMIVGLRRQAWAVEQDAAQHLPLAASTV
jgi:endonuclease/exonuclease/phosphatase (EEP) superfamily protein YafD